MPLWLNSYAYTQGSLIYSSQMREYYVSYNMCPAYHCYYTLAVFVTRRKVHAIQSNRLEQTFNVSLQKTQWRNYGGGGGARGAHGGSGARGGRPPPQPRSVPLGLKKIIRMKHCILSAFRVSMENPHAS